MQQATLLAPASPSVSLVNDRPATTSLEVAKFFGKRHDHVVRDIDNLMLQVPENFLQPNFGETTYPQETPMGTKQARMFILFRDGFMLLVMGYTGKKAMQIKIAYIEAFNLMEAQVLGTLAAQPALPDTTTPSTAADRRPLRGLVNTWSRLCGTHQQDLWPQVRAHFQLERIDHLPVEWIPDAIAFVQAKIDALATIEAKPEQEALPPSAPALPTDRKMYTDRMAQLDSLESRLLSFGCEARRAMQTFAHEYTKISEATFYELLYIRYTGKKVISGDPLVTPLTAMPYEAYQLMADSVERMRSAIRASKTANNFMANGVTGA